MKACIEDAVPRMCGYRSSSAMVRIGNTSAMPKARPLIGSTAQGSSSRIAVLA